ncbi:MAG: hypothetical protein A3B10_01140 [Candidatus Doudnabacteria bacterium RIFCSPLOWO2_01_FULL_44_21]|uniref:PpiC domain-containing protein n=1 Tax=Candidatus Doudnabacteria bacterium RIFCSPLOWO2_01_FULL_44_21 TaxID=1817841 RepID=A0A1F5PWR4_9BACT|nr:MAG: hypothetical protein A3B95_04050 [Candidatus Doudnabacteria bacterium RIFCSPHIGHO2_02_FULL_43_13b]OGE94391.1 MAG: hypothetical protein A3B10_01140 [Candidatus Doudnabacteria bacterium RIFCSPLOWO2_01_FULL_44_21]
MTRHHKKIWLGIFGAVILIALVLGFIYGVYPAAIVGGSVISIHDRKENLAIAKSLNSNVDPAAVFASLIRNRQKQILLGKLGIKLDSTKLADEFNYETTGKAVEFDKMLQDSFGGNQKSFLKYITLPQTQDALLRIKYNFYTSTNNNAYNKAKNILSRIHNNESFEDLAKTLSDDKVSGQLGGDLGFVAKGQILPELQSVIETAELGRVYNDLVTSRLGYHIVYPIETAEREGQGVWHIKHILVQTSGYEVWLNQQLEGISVWRIK